MSRLRFLGLAAGALLLSLAAVRTAWAQQPSAAPAAPAGQTCVIYSLADLGDDAELGRWIADTIPQVIEPGSWSREGEQGQMLRYFAPKKILVVYQSAAVQAKVDAFLKDMKQSIAAKTPEPKRSVAQADYRESAPPHALDALAEPGVSYSVPPPVKPPKHLFHMIIRYEGDGIIDDNVVKMIQAQTGGGQAVTAPAAVPSACLPPPNFVTPAPPATEPASKPAQNVEEKKDEKPVAPDDSSANTTRKDEKD